MRKLLPIGIQDFKTIRSEGFYYVDKTAVIHRLISGSARACFLARPRRFGKSLLCSTLAAVFEGRRELFAETEESPALAIDSLDWGWKKRPVIRIDMNAAAYSNGGVEELHALLYRELEREAKKLGVAFDGNEVNNTSRFAKLIEKACDKTGEKVIVIIDEYDKPLLNTMENPELHVKVRSELKGFYGLLKSYGEYLQFTFLTGVTKFSHVSLFSDLNHLSDITLEPRYADICGMTHEEVERDFGPEIDVIARDNDWNKEEYLDRLRLFYNGYRFSKKPVTVYNPFGLLNHFDKGEFMPYWYGTATPTFLVNLVAKQKIKPLDLTNLTVGLDDFVRYDLDNMRAEPLLYQTGYLTIRDYDEERTRFTLDYPNEEVRTSFTKSLLKQYMQDAPEGSQSLFVRLPDAVYDGNVEEMIETLRSFLASIPYDIIGDGGRESYYQTALHLIFTMLGINCRSEVRIAAGRIDTLVETARNVFCFEFKMDGTAEAALAQINTKEYLLPWSGSGKTLFKVGIVFDTEKRNIGEWKLETCRV